MRPNCAQHYYIYHIKIILSHIYLLCTQAAYCNRQLNVSVCVFVIITHTRKRVLCGKYAGTSLTQKYINVVFVWLWALSSANWRFLSVYLSTKVRVFKAMENQTMPSAHSVSHKNEHLAKTHMQRTTHTVHSHDTRSSFICCVCFPHFSQTRARISHPDAEHWTYGILFIIATTTTK